MRSIRDIQQSSSGLSGLLATCSEFDGAWPTDLDFYPKFWHARLRQGRGIGVGSKYRPWLKVRDLGSRGTSHVIFGIKSRRRHHLLSDYELLYFYLAERRASTCQIYEQWPILDLENTLRLCSELSVHHPYARGVPDPVTVDFLIAEQRSDGRAVRSVAIKSPEDASKPHVLRTLAVQQQWCTSHGLPWALADMSVVTDVRTTLESLKFLRWWFRLGARLPNKADSERFSHVFLDAYRRDQTLAELIARTAEILRIQRQDAIQAFRYAAWRAEIPVDLQRPIRLNAPLVLSNER